MKIKRELLVTGNMRTGTTWLTHALQCIGMDVMHECLGSDGSVSWPFALDWHWYCERPNNAPKNRTHHIGEGRRSDYSFKHVVHLVRDPIKTIGSMVSIMPTIEQNWLAEQGIIDMEARPKLLRMMQAWHAINARVEAQTDFRIKLERMQPDDDRDWRRLMKLLDRRDPLPTLPPKNTSRGIFKAKTITWDDLLDTDQRLAGAIMKMGKRYGY